MAQVPVVLVLVLVLMLCSARHGPRGFIETPTPLNVTGGEVAKFICTSARASALVWRVNGSELDDEIIQHQDITEESFYPGAMVIGSRLTIVTMRVTSTTKVECVATFSEGIRIHKSRATLRVQGPPGRVLGLMGESVNGTFHLSWTPPPTIDLTDIDPDLHYNITITRTTLINGTYDNIISIACDVCPLSNPQYSFTYEEAGPCVAYNFSVLAFNAAGMAETVFSSHGVTKGIPPKDSSLFTSSAELIENDKLRVNISSPGFQSEEVCCFTFKLDDVNVAAYPVEGGISVTLVNSSTLPFNHNYTVTITAHNVAGSTPYDGSFNLSTYDLQEAFINNGFNFSIDITGLLVKNSKARGFLVVVLDDCDNHERIVVIVDKVNMHKIDTTIAPVSEGFHRIHMFDIEANGFPGQTAAIVSSVLVSDGPQTLEFPVMNASDYSITEEDGLVCVPCTTPLTDCVIVAYSPSSPMNLTLPENRSMERSCFNLADGNYYFATFDNVTGINSDVIFYSVQSPDSPPTTTKPPPDISTNTNNNVAVAVWIPVVVILVTLMCFFGGCVWAMRQRNSHKKESLFYSEELYSVENTLMHRRAQVIIIEGDQPENPYITTGTDDTNMLSQLPSPENNSSEIHVHSTNMPLTSNLRNGELEDQTQDLEPISDWIHFPPPSYDAATSEFGHTITSSPLINLEPVNETNGTDSENVTETGEADIEPMYATPTAATSTKAEPMYANTCVGNTNQELAYATPELPKSTSKKPFLPKDTEVQYSEIQPCTEEGAISLPGCVVTEHGEMTRSVPEKSAIVSSSAIFFKPAAVMSVGTANAASTTEPTDAITATASITATKPGPVYANTKPELANATPELPKASKLAKETEVQHSSMMQPCTEEGAGGPQCLVMESSEVVTSTADDRKGYGTSMDVEGFNISTFSSHADDDSAYRNQRSDFRRESSPSSTSLLVVGSVSDQPPLQASSCGCWQMQKQLLPELQTRMRELNDMTTGSLVISALEKFCREERGDVKNISVQRQPSSDFNSLPLTLDSPLFTNQMQPSALPPSSGPCFHLPPPCGPCIYLPPSSGPRFLLPPSCAPHFLLPDCLGYGKTFPSITAVRKQGGRKTSKSQQRDAQMFMFLKGFMMKMLLHDVIRL